jgi:DNA polymerase-3 subunit epsilon
MHDEPWLIVDTETDGMMAPIHAVEIAAQRMCGWRREGEPFQALLNYEVPIDPGAEAVHGYSRAYLRRHGAPPLEAHAAFRAYAGNLPMVAYNLSFDWNRVLEPEYARLGVPVAGRRGFCALTLTRRVVREVGNYRLETLKNHFGLYPGRSHKRHRRPHTPETAEQVTWVRNWPQMSTLLEPNA